MIRKVAHVVDSMSMFNIMSKNSIDFAIEHNMQVNKLNINKTVPSNKGIAGENNYYLNFRCPIKKWKKFQNMF